MHASLNKFQRRDDVEKVSPTNGRLKRVAAVSGD
jgi:hypothetical protein